MLLYIAIALIVIVVAYMRMQQSSVPTLPECKGQWDWSACDETTGLEKGTFTVTDPSTDNGTCPSTRTDVRACQNKRCTGSWGDWGECATTGALEGFRIRSRNCFGSVDHEQHEDCSTKKVQDFICHGERDSSGNRKCFWNPSWFNSWIA